MWPILIRRGEVEVLVRDVESGAEILKIVVPVGSLLHTGHVQQTAPIVTTPGTDAGPVAGRIDGSPGELAAALARWREHLESLGLAKGSVKAFVGTVEMAVAERTAGIALATSRTRR